MRCEEIRKAKMSIESGQLCVDNDIVESDIFSKVSLAQTTLPTSYCSEPLHWLVVSETESIQILKIMMIWYEDTSPVETRDERIQKALAFSNPITRKRDRRAYKLVVSNS